MKKFAFSRPNTACDQAERNLFQVARVVTPVSHPNDDNSTTEVVLTDGRSIYKDLVNMVATEKL